MGKIATKNRIKSKDPLGFSNNVFTNTTFFEDHLVNYFLKKKVSKKSLTVKHFNKEDPAKIFGANKTTFISGKILHKKKYEDFVFEILEEKAISLCGQQVKITGVSGDFYSEEFSETPLLTPLFSNFSKSGIF